MDRFRNSTVYKYLTVFVLVSIVGIVLVTFFPSVTGAVLLFCMAIFAVTIQAWLVDLKRGLTRTEGNTVENIEIANRLNRKAVKIEITTNNIAGSVGRSAPLIRKLVQSNSGFVQRSTILIDEKANKPAITESLESKISKVEHLDNIAHPQRKSQSKDINVLMIADPFTAAAFSNEWNQFEPSPKDYLEVLNSNRIDLLFVESAWEGNQGTWKYQLVGNSAPRTEIVDLVTECKKRGIPTAFWNKEDPPHFEDFFDTAIMFDHIFTTEVECVSKYREATGKDNVHVLRFAAQPYYHNPARVAGIVREHASVFGGMYFREKFPERRAQMDYLLPAASEFGLDIYSRNTNEERYQFPPDLQKHVKGSLSYPQMLAAYHAYKIVLNVNSVPDSESMCARRIFEATACGAAVVSPPTHAIANIFGNGEIGLVADRESARNEVRALERSDFFRKRRVHVAQRVIWEGHTYGHRVREILKAVGIDEGDFYSKPEISIVVSTNRPGSLPFMVENIRRQSGVTFELAVLAHGFELDESVINELHSIDHISNLIVLTAPLENKLGTNLNTLVSHTNHGFIVRMDDDDWYGPNYVRDMYHAYEYSGADLIGKAATYIYFEERDATVLTFENHDHRYTNFVRGATFAGPRKTFEKFPFPELGISEDSTVLKSIVSAGGSIYSADEFNFVVNRYADKDRHTWKADDAALFATGRMTFVGNGQEQLAV